jgi:dGTPase
VPEIHEKKHVCSNEKEDFITILSGLVVHSYVKKTINYLTEQLGERKYKNIRELIQSTDLDTVMKNKDIYKVVEGDEQLHRFLKERMLSSHIAQVMDGRADFLIRRLFKAYISNPQQLPDNTIRIMMKTYRDYRQSKGYGNVAYSNVDFDEIPIGEIRKHLAKLQTRGRFSFRAIMLRTICDYISGMTDRRAISEYQNLYGIHN